MKKIAVLLMALLLACAPAAMAKAVDMDEFYVFFEGNCHVRTGPGLDFEKLGFYEKGETAMFAEECSIDERDVRWYLVAFEEDYGWVSSKYAVITNGEAEPILYCDESELCDYYQVVEQTDLMPEPALNGEPLEVLEKGDHAVNLGYFYFDRQGTSWAYVTYGGQAGWIENITAVGIFE